MTPRVLLVLALVAPALARADGNADSLRAQGVKAASRKDWEAARKLFEQSYALDPQSDTLYDLAAAQAKTDQLVEARASYKTFLDRADTDAHLRKLAQTALASLERDVPTLNVKLTGFAPGAAVTIDGKPVSEVDLSTPVVIDPGEHQIVVARGGVAIVKRSVLISRGARDEAVVAAPALPPPVPVKPPPERPPPLSTQPRRAEQPSIFASPWLWGAIAVAASAAAATYYYGIYTPPPGAPTHGTLGPGVVNVP